MAIKDYSGNTPSSSSYATTSNPGLMSATDKKKLDSLNSLALDTLPIGSEVLINDSTTVPEGWEEVEEETYYRKDEKEIPYTWAEIQTKIKNDDVYDINIGDWKSISLSTGEKVIMEVAGINCYRKYGGNTTQGAPVGNHIDFISRNCLKTTKTFANSGNNNGTSSEQSPFKAGPLYSYLNNTVYNQLPSYVQSIIIPKVLLYPVRYNGSGNAINDTGMVWGNYGKLWLPLEVEITGTFEQTSKGAQEGKYQYPIFRKYGTDKMVKFKGETGSKCSWHTASVGDGNYLNNICITTAGDNAGGNNATNSELGFPICFRVG